MALKELLRKSEDALRDTLQLMNETTEYTREDYQDLAHGLEETISWYSRQIADLEAQRQALLNLEGVG